MLESQPPPAADLGQLRRLLVQHFSADDLRSLCQDLGVAYDVLPGDGTDAKARELIAFMERRGRLADLLAAATRERPQVARGDAGENGDRGQGQDPENDTFATHSGMRVTISEPAPPAPVQQAANLLRDVSGVVAAIVAYVLALSGNAPGPIPKTTALITVLVTTTVVWLWRARCITRCRIPTTDATRSAVQPTSGGSKARMNRLLDPIRNPSIKLYSMSLARRRMELAGLVVLTVAVAAWSVTRVSGAAHEFARTPPRLCSSPQPQVAIAEFEQAPAQTSYIAGRLYDALTEDPARRNLICRLRDVVVRDREEAQAVSQKTKAILVIWGRIDALYEVHVEIAADTSNAWDLQGPGLRRLPSEQLADFKISLQEPDLLSFLTDFVLSEMLYVDNQTETARQVLGQALERAKEKDLEQGNAADLGKAYFLLGFMYDPNVQPTEAITDTAVTAYSRSLELNPGLQAARLNRGMLYRQLNKIDLATADYSALIAQGGPLAADGALNRAILRADQADRTAAEQDFALAIKLNPLDGYFQRGLARRDMWNDLDGAVSDFEAPVPLEPPDYFYYLFLGETQLRAGRTAAARETYVGLMPRIDQDTRQEVIKGLEELAEANPSLAAAATQIATELRRASSP